MEQKVANMEVRRRISKLIHVKTMSNLNFRLGLSWKLHVEASGALNFCNMNMGSPC